MKRKLTAIIMIIVFAAMFLLLAGCDEQQSNENGEEYGIAAQDMNEQIKQIEEQRHIASVTASSIEELENIIRFARAMEVGGFWYDDYSVLDKMLASYGLTSAMSIRCNYISDIESYYVPSENAFEGFELDGIVIGRANIRYYYMPIGVCPLYNSAYSVGIAISLNRSDMMVRFDGDPLDGIAIQIGIDVNEDGLIYDPCWNSIYAPIGNTFVRIRVADHLNNYEFLRDLVFSEFIPENIICVDEMIARRAGELAEVG